MGNSHNKELFLAADDDLGKLINLKANELFFALKNFDAAALDSNGHYNDYFIQHHLGNRLFFSIQNSAHILYEAVKISGKPLHEINAIDYGAGLGTLFMLGGMLGFRRFDYNDYLPEWQSTAEAVCKSVGISIHDYITGDINEVVDFAASEGFIYDIVVSRNVIEHIYSLPKFYASIFKHNRAAVIFSTTTANYHNPVMRLYHIYIHKKVERLYYGNQRMEEIKKINPLINENDLVKLKELTRGKGQQDFIEAVKSFKPGIPVSQDSSLRTNTCDCITGVWSEHLLTKNEYKSIIGNAGFKMSYTAGYWDTHYPNKLKNIMASIFNRIIFLSGRKNGILFSPFVNVVAYK